MGQIFMDQPIKTFTAGSLKARIYQDQPALARAAAAEVHAHLTGILSQQFETAVILATGNSQLQFLKNLSEMGGLDWSRVTLFHMDEYLGLPESHAASFRNYMKKRVESILHPKAFHYLNGESDQPIRECDRYTRLLQAQTIDLCCLGIGENGHIAFNDPAVADFEDDRSVKIVELDEACRMQQVGEGHFPDMQAVPRYALTLTIPMLLSARKLICLSPETRKAAAVLAAIEGPIDTACPASILREHPDATLFLDTDSSAKLTVN